MADVDELAGLLTSARQGDQDAFLRAQEQLSPFVHALIICRAPHHLAGNLVRHTMVQSAIRLDELTDARAFIAAVFDLARHLGDQSHGPEDLATDPLLADGRKLLAKLRALQMPLRERLMMRLLEGLTGPEIADLLGVNEEEIRSSLDHALCEHLHQPAGAFTTNGYLWSMIGNPPDALVKLENLLTPLRFDLALLSAGDESTDVTPVNPVKAVKRPTEGRKPTGESLAAPAPKASTSHGGLKAPSSAPRHPAPSGNTNTHVRTQSKPQLESTEPSGSALTSANPVPDRTDATAHSLPPVPESPVLVAAAPGIAAPQSTGTVARTIQASDLPAAAAFDLSIPPRLSPPVLTREAPPEVEPPPVSDLSPLPPAWPSRPPADDDKDESTIVQPTKVPLVTAPVKAAAPRPGDPDTTAAIPMSVQVRRSLLAEAQAPRELADDPHMTRAVLPPVEPFAQRGSVFSSYRPFVVAAVFALVAIGVVALMLSGVENRVKKGWNLVPVVVAAADLPEGTTIGLESISQRAVPEQFVTSSVVRPDSTDYVINQRLLVPVQAGDPLLWTQFEASRVGERLSRKIQKKARALAIRASSTMAVGGWVTPNDRIDIIASFSKPNSQERTAVTLLNDVPVISAGKITATTLASQRERDKEYQDVTVLVIPEEAEIITLAARLARLKFTLRGDDSERDDITDARYRTEITTLLSGEKVQVIQKKRWELLKSIRAAKKARDL